MKRCRPSGAEQRKRKKARELESQALSKSILKFVTASTSTAKREVLEHDNGPLERIDHEIETPPTAREEVIENTAGINVLENENGPLEESGHEIETPPTVREEVIENTVGIKVLENQNGPLEESGHEIETPPTAREEGYENSNEPKHILSQRNEDKLDVNESSSLDQENSDVEEEDIVMLPLHMDIGYWPIPVPHTVRVEIIKKGSKPIQNKDGPFVAVVRHGENQKGSCRQLTTSWFYKILQNGEKVLRTWMVYSPLKESLFCFCCRLFATDEEELGVSKFVTGFQTWWKLNPRVGDHENSERHLTCLEKWKTLRARLINNKTIDHLHQDTIENERKKWRDILHRLLDVSLYLAKQNLPFRGHRENSTSENRGNFLELIEMLSNYDPIIKEHLVRIQQSTSSGKIVTTYLSPKIQNEFISVLGNSVKDKILFDIKHAKYFGIIFDSTPDVSHTDQMCEIIRYVHVESGKVEVRESFLGFFSLAGKKADALTEDILKNLEKDGLDIDLCRSQGYDNASTMAGIHAGVQARIRQINPKALFVPCANHSLNLCGLHSFGSVPSCVTFFGTLESVFTFFSASTHRWAVLKKYVDITAKRLSETRWSAHHDAVKPVKNQFNKFVEAIEELCEPKENFDTRGSAQLLMTAVCDFSFLVYLSLWDQVLTEVNETQKYLQIAGVSFDKCVKKLRCLKLYLNENRSKIVESSIEYATELCVEMDIPIERKGRRKFKKMMPGEKTKDIGLTLEQELKRAMFECIDRFHLEIKNRFKSMEHILTTFAVVQTDNLVSASDVELQEFILCLIQTFDEFSKSDMILEIARLRRLLKAAEISKEVYQEWSALNFLQFIVDYDFCDSVPNLSLALRFFLTICVSVSSCERSFSKLRLIKNYLRSTMSQSRLSNLALLSIEHKIAKNINLDEVISHFADLKVRKQYI